MKLGTRHAGVRIERAQWGMPARITLYGGRDPFAGPGSIPWRFYWAREIRAPLRFKLYWSMICDQSVGWTGRSSELAWVEVEWGVGWKRRVRTIWAKRCYRPVRAESLISHQCV